MSYVNKLQQYLDIFALSLSLKNNDNWYVSENKSNYSTLFSIYSKMLEQDQEEFFARSTDKEAIIRSLNRSKAFYSVTNNQQLLHMMEQLTPNDPADFLIVPLRCSVTRHTFGSYIYKEEDRYKIFFVNKQMKSPSIDFATIPNNNMPSFCEQLVLKNDNPNPEQPFYIYKKIVEQSNSKQATTLSYKMHPQKAGNCVVKEIEATLKTALFHCRHDLFASQNFKKIKWNDKSPTSTIDMQDRFLSAIKAECKGPSEPFDLLSELFLQRKTANLLSYPLTIQEKEKINQNIQDKMNTYPEIQQILEGKSIYKFSNGLVNKRLDFFVKEPTEIENNKLEIKRIHSKKSVKEKVMLFEKITQVKNKTEINFQENNKNKNTKSQVPLSINR